MKKILILFILICCVHVHAQFTTLLNFSGIANGRNPYRSLTYDGTFLYGMTFQGGANDKGTIFRIKPDGTGDTILMNCSGVSNGTAPTGSLFYDGTFLYGMTYGGGTNNMGTIFKIKTDGTGYAKLLDFAGASNGADPWGSLTSDGTFLYGMTYAGGTNDSGVVFRIKTDGTGDTVLLNLTSTIGSLTEGSLYCDGTFLYGMTIFGGTSNKGTLFRIKTDGTGDTVLLNFTGANGSSPLGSLISDGTFLYGMTEIGGTSNNGTIFKIMPDGTGYSNLYNFAGSPTDGGWPRESLIYDGTFLYGVTYFGGMNNYGTLFKIMPNGSGYAKLMDFTGVATGSRPSGSLVSDGTFLYGMTPYGGANNYGVIFKYAVVTGVTENNVASTISVYPNPSSGNFFVEATGDLIIYNLCGEKIVTEKVLGTTEIDLSEQPDGIYFITVKTEKEYFTQKIIIQK